MAGFKKTQVQLSHCNKISKCKCIDEFIMENKQVAVRMARLQKNQVQLNHCSLTSLDLNLLPPSRARPSIPLPLFPQEISQPSWIGYLLAQLLSLVIKLYKLDRLDCRMLISQFHQFWLQFNQGGVSFQCV